MKRLVKYLIALCLCIASLNVAAQVQIVKDGKSKSKIVLSKTDKNTQKAAEMMQRFILEISGVKLHIVSNDKLVSKGDIVIGVAPNELVGEGGFVLNTKDGVLSVLGNGKGCIYGVTEVLEQYFGVSYWTSNTYDLKKSKNLSLPKIYDVQTPAFRYRQSQNYAIDEDADYTLWYRLDNPSDAFVNSMWVHTFNTLLPSDVYGKSHPEYYSMINGERRPGHNSQWCLTNNEVFEIVSGKLDSIFKANPNLKLISVSQNDGNFTNCSCPECKAVDEYEGAVSGNYIRFMNKLAERFPDKEFSTLAYLFTMDPPKHVKPLPNVNIMLCDIDCKRELPLTENASGRLFMKALEGWSKISDNIFVWDYGINFDNMVAPFPNFHIIQKNIQIFKEHNAKMHFSQIGGFKGGDFSELRTYMVSKLMWNPYRDADSLMQSFLNGYYGAAARYIDEYISMQTGGLLASGKDLWIYDSPNSHKDGFLNKNLLKIYSDLFDKAEAAVANDAVKLRRVKLSRLSLEYAVLEHARTDSMIDVDDIKMKLSSFEEFTAKEGVLSLNERGNAPSEYCKLYMERYLPQDVKSKALGAKITWILPPHSRYMKLAETSLTDGLYGGTTFMDSWVGWEGVDGAFVLDLGEIKSFSRVETDFLQQLGQWIIYPKGGRYFVSNDGKEFCKIGSFAFEEDRSMFVTFKKGTVELDEPINARYIKLEIDAVGPCPYWHFGVGYPSWFFIDEISVF